MHLFCYQKPPEYNLIDPRVNRLNTHIIRLITDKNKINNIHSKPNFSLCLKFKTDIALNLIKIYINLIL